MYNGKLHRHVYWIAIVLLQFVFANVNPVNLYAELEAENFMRITILFDNTTLNPSCQAEWGFACLVESEQERVLFDAGADGDILLHNFEKLGIPPTGIDKIIISHMHGDHTGGLSSILEKNQNSTVYFVQSATDEQLGIYKKLPIKIKKVKDFTKISDNLYSLGEMQGKTNEQSIVIKTKHGIVIITGCAHPGIVEIVKKG